MFYEVQAIIDKKLTRGKPWYLVKWLHYPTSQATWQPPYTLSNAKQLIQQYEIQVGTKKFDQSILLDDDYGLCEQDFVQTNRKRLRKKKKVQFQDSLIIETKQMSNELETNRDAYSESLKMNNEEEVFEEDEMQSQSQIQNFDQQLEFNQMIPQNFMEIESEQKDQKIQQQPFIKDQNIKEITHLKKLSDGMNSYLIQKQDGTLQKIQSKDIARYPNQFHTFLKDKIRN